MSKSSLISRCQKISLLSIGACVSITLSILALHLFAFFLLPDESRRVSKEIQLVEFREYEPARIEDSIKVSIEALFPHAESIENLPYWIRSAAQMNNVDPYLLAGIIAQESSFRTGVTSWSGAVGLAQVKPEFWEESCGLKVDDPYNNVICSAYILRKLLDKHERLNTALAVYNVGDGNYRQSDRYRLAGYRYASSVISYSYQLNVAGASELIF